MRRNLLTVVLLALSLTTTAQTVICHVDAGGLFFVGENALVYNGGGVQTRDTGIYDIKGNVMVVGGTNDGFRTLNSTGGDKTDGGNVILRLNTPGSAVTSTYGQLYINNIAQGNLTGVVDKEFRTPKHGTYQQIALPFNGKLISSLSGASTAIGTLGKTFNNVRYSKNEVLRWNNTTVVSENMPITGVTPKNTNYYMLGSLGLDTDLPPAGMITNAPTATGAVFTLRGVPYTNGATELLNGSAANPNLFGPGGNNRNSYNEKYNTYIEDPWDATVTPSNPYSVTTFGRNMYQFGNPYLTNLDLSAIGYVEPGATTDGNALTAVQGIRYDPGTVFSLPNGSTTTTSSKFISFTNPGNQPPTPVGDVGFIIKPMQTFVVKMRNNDSQIGLERTLSFDGLRRFKNTPRTSGDYSVTNKDTNVNTVKQLGVIGLDESGQELARTYYAVYPTAVTGKTSLATVQIPLSSDNILGTYEEDINGGYDMNYVNSYWLYINEANETDFFGKAVPLKLYSDAIKSLKFEIRENAGLIEDGIHNLSTGIGFYYKTANGTIAEIAQNQVIPVSGDEYNLYYGKSTVVLGTEGTTKLSRTMVVYNGAIDKFVVRFDPNWKKSDVNVFDMSGKLIISQKDVLADKDFEINLAKINTGYIVTAISDKGEKISAKIIR